MNAQHGTQKKTKPLPPPGLPKYLTTSRAARRLRDLTGLNISPSTLWRWCTAGVTRGTDRVRLQSIRLGRRHLTTEDWITNFLQALATARTSPISTTQPEEALEGAGLM